MSEKKTGLELLREPFAEHLISKLPKPTKQQTDEVRANFKAGIRCVVCGGWHHPNVVHLDYVGHAALTHRLLDADPAWTWEPVAIGQNGLPVLDDGGGLWIRLTVCGVTRLGYGDAQGKVGGDAMKERIGDALRNAAMRFGAALDMWHKGDLHAEDGGDQPEIKIPEKPTHSATDGAFNAQDVVAKEQIVSRYNRVIDAASVGEWEEAYKAYDEVQGEGRIALRELLRPHSAIRSRLAKMFNEKQLQPQE